MIEVFMSENMTDLEWLARRVHKWTPDDPNHKLRLHKADALNAEGWTFAHCYSCGYSFDEWQAERARLQNKPKWSDAPEWAEWLAQWPDGEWLFYPRRPNETNFGYCLEHSFGERLSSDMYGETLGDWRYTLERRPVSDMPSIHENMRCVMSSDIEKIEPDWRKAPDGATHYSEHGYMRWYKCENGGVCGYSGKRWVPLPLDVFSEKDKEALMEKPKEWRGPEDGLPPVGTKCEVRTGYATEPYSYEECDIIAHFRGTNKMCAAYTTVNHDGSVMVNQGTIIAFRPLRTEEDKSVEEMVNIITKTYTDSKSELPSELPHRDSLDVYLREIYRAGYRKQDASE